jgi:hypothetical protein
MKEVGFGLTGMAWNEGSWFWLDWKIFKLRKLVFGLIIMPWNGKSRFWPD